MKDFWPVHLILVALVVASGNIGKAQVRDDLKPIAGVAIYSRGALGHDLAVASPYLRLETFQQTYTISTSTTALRILKKELYENIPITAFSSDFLSDVDKERIETEIRSIESASTKFRSSAVALTDIASEMKKMLVRYDAGEVYVGREWKVRGSEASPMQNVSSDQVGILVGLDGVTYRNPTFLRAQGGYVHFRHADGFSKIEIDSLPDPFKKQWAEKLKEALMASAVTEAVPKMENSVNRMLDWSPLSVNDAIECVVLIEGDVGSGTGFLCFHDDEFFIYTNAHVLAGNRRLRITTPSGKTLSNYKYIETAPKGYDNGDLVRLALSETVEKALRLVEGADGPKIDGEVWALGNSQGSGVIRSLEGKVVGVGPARIEITSEIVKGNSGGPVIDDLFRVVGVSSFGEYRVDIWSKGTQLEGVRRFALRPEAVDGWDRFSSSDFLRVSYLYDQMVADIVLTKVIGMMTFTSNGIEYKQSEKVINDMNANEVVNSFKGHDFADAILRFNKELEGRSGNAVGGDLVHRILVSYATLFSNGQVAMSSRRRAVQAYGKVPYFISRKLDDILQEHAAAEEVILKTALEINKILKG